MEFLSLLATISFLLCIIPASFASLAPITIVGPKFYDVNGNQFYIKGVIYSYPDVSKLVDVLTNTAQCTRDASLMRTLGVNTISVYFVDQTQNHSGCMSAFDNVGIFVLIGLGTPTNSITRVSPTWTTSLLNSYSAVVDSFSNFTNTLGFFVGNEVVLDMETSLAALYLKAATTDLKIFQDKKGYRKIPIGYSSADVAVLAPFLQNYFVCGSGSIDFFGQNNYQWCSPSSFTASGYDKLYANASGYSIPMFFSETGCEGNSPRTFDDQEAVLGAAMNRRWSGSIVYQWSESGNGYGLVSYSGGAATGTPTPLPSNGFSSLRSRWSTLSPTSIPVATTAVSVPACPAFTSSGWQIQGDAVLPTLLQAVVSAKASSTGSQTSTGRSQSTEAGTSSITIPLPSGAVVDNQNAKSTTGISTGVAAGIAVACVFFGIFAACAGFFFLKRRKQAPKSGSKFDLGSDGPEVAQVPSTSRYQEAYTKSELPAATIGVGEPRQKAELPTSNPNPHEMDVITHSTSDLSSTPLQPEIETILSHQQPSATQPTSPLPVNDTPTSWSNSPWDIEPYPFHQPEEVNVAQKVPLLSSTDATESKHGNT